MEEIKGKSLNAICILLILKKVLDIRLKDVEVFGLKLRNLDIDTVNLLIWIAFGFYLFEIHTEVTELTR